MNSDLIVLHNPLSEKIQEARSFSSVCLLRILTYIFSKILVVLTQFYKDPCDSNWLQLSMWCILRCSYLSDRHMRQHEVCVVWSIMRQWKNNFLTTVGRRGASIYAQFKTQSETLSFPMDKILSQDLVRGKNIRVLPYLLSQFLSCPLTTLQIRHSTNICTLSCLVWFII